MKEIEYDGITYLYTAYKHNRTAYRRNTNENSIIKSRT